MVWWVCWDGVSQNFVPRLEWNCDPPDLGLPCSWDDMCEAPAPGYIFSIS
jgi:hypothetical protein